MEQFKPGNIVKIRNRIWRINKLYRNQLEATSIDSFHNINQNFYIPLEEIKLADRDKPDLSKVGELSKQKLFLTANRISLVHGSSPLLSLQRSSIIPTDFQLVPVIMALNSPFVRLLIADDVGLGKTIEAGLILNELIARHQAQKILVVCPASLREQWQEALKYQFKLDFSIISTLHRRYLEKELPVGASPWEYFDRLICSIDYAKTKRNRNEILNYKWDMVIFDEAHLCAKPHSANPNHRSSMLRWQFLKRIATKTMHLLLLTATPHNGYSDSFASLIERLNANAIDDDYNIKREIAKKHVCQRTRKDVTSWLEKRKDSFNPFPESDKKEVPIEKLSRNEVRVYKMLSEYGEELKKMIPFTEDRNSLVQFTILHFLKRFLSSPNAIKNSLLNRINKIDSSDISSEINPKEAQSTITEVDDMDNIDVDEAGKRIERTTFSEEVNRFEIETLREIYKQAKKITYRNDKKFQKLINNTIPELYEFSPKIIIFTRYVDTLLYLHKGLKRKLKDSDIFFIYGGMSNEQRKEVFVEFDNTEKNAILIATDCISEGMNLQYLCSQIIHYELPWNPNRMEQRNGRVDRFGQPEDLVHIRTMIVKHTLDDIILKNIIEKSDRMKQDYGFSPPFFSDEKKIIDELIATGKRPQTRKRDTHQVDLMDRFKEPNLQQDKDVEIVDIELEDKMKQIKSESFYGHSNISLPQIQKKLEETAQTVGSEEEIKNFIISGLQLFNSEIEKFDDKLYNISINDNRLKLPGQENEILNATFDKNFAVGKQNATLIDLSHPLVNRLIRLVKQQSVKDKDFYGRTAYKGSDQIEQTAAVLKILVRFVVETQPSSMIEELFTIGFDVYDKKILSHEIVENFEQNEPKTCTRTDQEVREDLQEAFSDNFWQNQIQEKIEKRQRALIKDRENLVERLELQETVPQWLDGITNISFVRYDILTITIGYPV